ncbi:MAG: carbohydrate-binding domain-containing protein, partial [Clostridia bacterium]|nr:carbohydrate-binding domain-containing protein [Clostridia bacterium]
MQKFKVVISMVLVLACALGVLPFTSFAQSALNYDYTQTGNTGAVIKLTSGTLKSVENKSENLVNVTVSDNVVTVSAVAAVTGIAKIVLSDTSSNTQTIEIPIGYTTFILNNDELTVYEGNDTKYDITGINIAGEEFSEEATDEAYLLTHTENSDGSKTYTNTDNYSLSINIGKKGGTYVFSGCSDNMAISVKKEATGAAVLLLASLDLTSKFTSPLTIKKSSTTTVKVSALAGSENTLTDAALNNADIYGDTADGGDGTNAAFAESAVIKGKTAANLTLSGSGTINLVCNSKNAIKIAQSGRLTIEGLTLNIESANHGISVDNVLTINTGNISVTAEGDAIRSNPDSVDADNGYAGNIIINGGSFTIQAGSDGIQAAQDITITGGSFNIKTLSGYNSTSFNGDTMSCKGIKASASEDVEEATNTITISGGNFYLNTADDAIHSDAYITVSEGTFEIYTGDDGMHADTSLTLGNENGLERDVQVTINASYEGLEAGNVYIYSGKYYVIASDDGINAAGGSSSGSDPGAGGGNHFNPGGGPGGPGGNQGGPGSNQGGAGGNTSSSSDYAINIYGGDIYINVDGDGIDSNGDVNIYGGSVEVWGMKSSGDNEPIDHDGNL